MTQHDPKMKEKMKESEIKCPIKEEQDTGGGGQRRAEAACENKSKVHIIKL